MTSAHVVIDDAVILTMDAARSVVRGWVGVRDGVIASIGTGPAPAASERIDARGGILHPGYISAHQHTMDTLARRELAHERPFFDWLFGTYYGAVLALSPADAGRAARQAAADLVRAGVTTVVDCWGVGDVGSPRASAALGETVAAARASGLRWIVAPMVSDRLPAAWHDDLAAAEARGGFRRDALIAPTETAIRFAAEALALAGGTVGVWTSVELPEMASDELLLGLRALAAPGFTTHLAASEAGAAGDGERAVARLARLGMLNRRLLGAHLTCTEAAERDLLAARGCGGAHCAAASLFGGASRSALGELREAGLAMGLGLDNATLNTTPDMVGEMRHALAFDRAAGSGATRVTPGDLLAHATIEGARALGMADRIGSIESGKRADLVLLEPSADLAGADDVVLRSRPDDIRLVMVDGVPVLGAREAARGGPGGR